MKAYDLAVVMPVYNEAEAIGPVLKKWGAMLDTLGIRYHIRAYNDGSKDATGKILRAIAEGAGGRVLAIDKPNSGHGPTILRGYREAAEVADWVFQIDSDDEMGPEAFPVLWAARERRDFLVGKRDGRRQPLARKVVSFVSRLCVRLFYGKGVWDVNSPYRLMRAERFAPFYAAIPGDTFAPNVLLSGLAARHGLRVLEVPVPQHDRTTGEVSIKKWRLFRAAVRSFGQTIGFALSGGDEEEGSCVWRLGVKSFALLGIAFALFLLRFRTRCLLFPVMVAVLVGVCWWRDRPHARRVTAWVECHPIVSLGILLGLGMVLRVGYVLVFPDSLSEAGWNEDYRILWRHAQTFAQGAWPISKSWVTVGYYGSVVWLFGVPSTIVAMGATLLLKAAMGCGMFVLARRWMGSLGALVWVATFCVSPFDIAHTPYVATEHTYQLGVLFAWLFATWASDSRRWFGTLAWGGAFAVAAWLATWSRGEGILLFMVAPGLFALSALGERMSWRHAAAFGLALLLMFALGAKCALALNETLSGAQTVFCSDDNLWPRLFGANVKSQGQWNAEDKVMIWERYAKDHPGASSAKTHYGVPDALAAQCPKDVAPYVRAEIAARWQRMSLRECGALLWTKANIVWGYDTRWLDFPIAKVKRVLFGLLFSALPAFLATAALLFFVAACFCWGLASHPTLWLGLCFLLGNAALLCATEAAGRYGFLWLTVFGLYASGLLAKLFRPGNGATRPRHG